jgi:pilus assembly protein Flp/PilA
MSYSRIARLTAALDDGQTNESGQGLVEYALILLLVALAAIGGLGILGTSVNDLLQTAADAIP